MKMIFVTVGTHEQQFNRLVECVDRLRGEGVLEECVMQTGYSTYEPKHCTWKKFYPYQEMKRLVDEARVIITHGGPSSFIMSLQVGKTPIVVPRKKAFEEHVNDHQVSFCNAVSERMGNILVVDEIESLGDVLAGYEERVQGMSRELKSNNHRFCEELQRIVQEMFGDNVEYVL
jgi:UDP-N-acetylglucosamine transferase subunit ALG13